MALEPNFDFIDELNPLNPADNDPVEEGDDHLRGIKNALKGNVTGDATQTRLLVAGAVAFRQQNRGWDSITPTGNALSRLINESDGFVQLDLQNQVAGGWQLSSAGGSPSLLIQQLTAGGAFDSISASFARGAGVTLNYAGEDRLVVQNDGIRVKGSTDSGSQIRLANLSGSTLGLLGFEGSDRLRLRNSNIAGVLSLEVAGAGGNQIAATFSPDGASVLNFDGTQRLLTTTPGAQALGTLFDLANESNTTLARYVCRNTAGGYDLRVDDVGDVSLTQRTGADGAGQTWAVFYRSDGFEFRRGNNAYINAVSVDRIRMVPNLDFTGAGLTGDSLFNIAAGTGGANLGNGAGADASAVVNLRAGDGTNIAMQLTENTANLYGSNVPALNTVIDSARTTRNSGAEVKDGSGSFQAVGYNLMPLDTVNVNKTLTAAAIGRMERVITSGITVTVDVGLTGQTVCLINVAAAPITIAKAAGVAAINWFTGDGLNSSTTPLTIEPGGACTMFWEGTTVVGVWGTGISR